MNAIMVVMAVHQSMSREALNSDAIRAAMLAQDGVGELLPQQLGAVGHVLAALACGENCSVPTAGDCMIQLPVVRRGKNIVITMRYELVLNRPSQHPRRETAPRERISGIPGPTRSTPVPRTLRNTADFWGCPNRRESPSGERWRPVRGSNPCYQRERLVS
jgi:hypothetical protein